MQKDLFQAYMRAAEDPPRSAGQPSCPAEEALVTFYTQSPDTPADPSVAAHLKQCPHCSQLLRDIADFMDPVRAGETFAPARTEQAFRTFRSAASRSATLRFSSASFWPMAAAAALVIAFGAALLIQSARFSTERNQLLSQARALRTDLEKSATLRPPAVSPDTLVVDLFPESAATRSQHQSAFSVSLPVGKPACILIHVSGKSGAYSAELRSTDGVLIWQVPTVHSLEGSCVITLSNGLPAKGEYLLQMTPLTGSGVEIFRLIGS